MLPFPPECREPEVVSALPADLRKGACSSWADRHLGGGALDAFLEGPVVDGSGRLYMVDIPFGRLLCLEPSGHWSVAAAYDGWPNGMKMPDEKTFLIADQKRGLVEIERDSGRARVIAAGIDGQPFHGLNDLAITSGGDVLVTDQGLSGLQDPFGRVLCLHRNGGMHSVMAGIPSPNGLVLSADERTLYLAVTRANAIWRLPLDDQLQTFKAGLFIQLSGGIGPDGLARMDDRLLAAHPGIGIWEFAADGMPRVLWRRRDGANYCTNLAADPTRPGSFLVTESMSATVLRITAEGGARGGLTGGGL
ncbi:MAG: SMP-30/gluconolactonase/LRE family protein [Alphaproteobacteria bacterium]